MEEQIQKAQEKVIKTKAAYDTAVESLQKLLDKRDAQRKDELWKLKKTYADTCQKFERANPDWARHLTNFACYLVFRHWHKTVNDDALYGRAAMAGAACMLMYHLYLLEWLERGVLFPATEAALWSAFSREVEHLEENLTDFIEAMFDNENWPILAALSE